MCLKKKKKEKSQNQNKSKSIKQCPCGILFLNFFCLRWCFSLSLSRSQNQTEIWIQSSTNCPSVMLQMIKKHHKDTFVLVTTIQCNLNGSTWEINKWKKKRFCKKRQQNVYLFIIMTAVENNNNPIKWIVAAESTNSFYLHGFFRSVAEFLSLKLCEKNLSILPPQQCTALCECRFSAPSGVS